MAQSKWLYAVMLVACAGAQSASANPNPYSDNPGRFPHQVGAVMPPEASNAVSAKLDTTEAGNSKTALSKTALSKIDLSKTDEITTASLPSEKGVSTRSTKREARALSFPESATPIRALIARHAAEQGVPVALADAVVRVESRYNPRARNGSYLGLSQISYRTARGIGYSGSAAGLMDADTNLRYGMKYLAQAYRLANGDTCGTVMRYQSGHAAKRMNNANRVYCGKVRTIVASR